MNEAPKLLVEMRGQVALLTMNKPKQRNALCTELLAELRQCFRWLAQDDSVRVIVLAGAGKGFCAGADLSNTDGFATGEEGIEEHYKPAFMEIVTIRKPVIACVAGGAAGGGMALAMCCDLMVMSEDAYLKPVFSDLALVPDCGLNWMLPRALGYQKAYEVAIEARRLDAAECLQTGLANRVVPAEELVESTLAWAETLSRRAPLAMGWTKTLMRDSFNRNFEEAFTAEGPAQDICLASGDFIEGFKAFFEKRNPVFKGS